LGKSDEQQQGINRLQFLTSSLSRSLSLPNLALACCSVENYRGRMKLQQGEIWKCSEEFVRIVHLERLEVGYKSFKSLTNSGGKHHRATKKDFCRMLKGATLSPDSSNLIQK